MPVLFSFTWILRFLGNLGLTFKLDQFPFLCTPLVDRVSLVISSANTCYSPAMCIWFSFPLNMKHSKYRDYITYIFMPSEHSTWFMEGPQEIFVIRLSKYRILLVLLICVNYPEHPEYFADIHACILF